jgi:hypothetical protein
MPGKGLSQGHQAMLGLRPEVLFELHPDFRTLGDWRRYFRAGGTLDKIPERERGPDCFRAAVEADAAAIRRLPLNRRTPAFVCDLLRRNGLALAHLPLSMLVPGRPGREALVEAAVSGPHLPRVRHLPADLLTTDLCRRLLGNRPLDIGDAPEGLLTGGMCVAAIGAMSARDYQRTWARIDNRVWTLIEPRIWALIPMRLRGAAVADALADFCLQHGLPFKVAASDFPPSASASRNFQDLMALGQPAQFLRSGGGTRSLQALASFCAKLPHRTREIEREEEGVIALETVVTAIQGAARRSGIPLDRPVTLPLPTGEMRLADLGERSVLRWALTHHGDWIRAASDRNRNDVELCGIALASGWCVLYDIPFEVIQAHPDLAIQVMRRREPGPLDDVEFDPLTGITPNVWALFDGKTKEALCREILPRFGHALESLSELEPDLLTDDMYALAASGGCDLNDIPQRLQPALREVSVLKQYNNLYAIEEDDRTLALCELAIASNPKAWNYVPARHLCGALEARAMKMVSSYLREWIDQADGRLTDRFLIRAVKEGGADLDVLPDHMHLPQIFRIHIRRDPRHMRSLSTTNDWGPALADEMLREDGSRIRFLAAGHVTPAQMTVAYQHGAARDDLMPVFDYLETQGRGKAQLRMAEFETLMGTPDTHAGE